MFFPFSLIFLFVLPCLSLYLQPCRGFKKQHWVYLGEAPLAKDGTSYSHGWLEKKSLKIIPQYTVVTFSGFAQTLQGIWSSPTHCMVSIPYPHVINSTTTLRIL